MDSQSDWPIMSKAVETLEEFGAPYETQVLSAHRMVDELFSFAEGSKARGLRAIIAGTPVATFAIGEAGAINAALFAISLLATTDTRLRDQLVIRRREKHDGAEALVELSRICTAVTIEFENLPVSLLQFLSQHVVVRPSPACVV